MKNKRGYKRSERVSRSLLKAISEAVRDDVSDPGLEGVMITRVELTDDLRFARVLWYLLPHDDERVQAADEAFERATGRLRGSVARRVQLKKTPELRFVYDRGVDNSARVDELLAGLKSDL